MKKWQPTNGKHGPILHKKHHPDRRQESAKEWAETGKMFQIIRDWEVRR